MLAALNAHADKLADEVETYAPPPTRHWSAPHRPPPLYLLRSTVQTHTHTHTRVGHLPFWLLVELRVRRGRISSAIDTSRFSKPMWCMLTREAQQPATTPPRYFHPMRQNRQKSPSFKYKISVSFKNKMCDDGRQNYKRPPHNTPHHHHHQKTLIPRPRKKRKKMPTFESIIRYTHYVCVSWVFTTLG